MRYISTSRLMLIGNGQVSSPEELKALLESRGHCSHICHQACVTPSHCYWHTIEHNGSLHDCQYRIQAGEKEGIDFICPHSPKCLSTTNDPNSAISKTSIHLWISEEHWSKNDLLFYVTDIAATPRILQSLNPLSEYRSIYPRLTYDAINDTSSLDPLGGVPRSGDVSKTLPVISTPLPFQDKRSLGPSGGVASSDGVFAGPEVFDLPDDDDDDDE